MKHAESWTGAGYTLCGLALEAAEDDCTGETEPVTIAERGEVVGCASCRAVIRHVYQKFTTTYARRK
jgi:hypothetical protein